MTDNAKTEGQFFTNWKHSILAWLVSSAILLMAAAGLLSRGIIPYAAAGYLSSIISFLAAVFAGVGLRRGDHLNLITIISGALCLVIVLLTIGYFISHGELSSSGILSTASFTLTGFLTGALLTHDKKGKKRNTSFVNKRKKR